MYFSIPQELGDGAQLESLLSHSKRSSSQAKNDTSLFFTILPHPDISWVDGGQA